MNVFSSFWCFPSSPLLWWDGLWAAVLSGGLLTSVPLVGHERFVDRKVLDVRLQDVDHICLTGNHDQLGEDKRVTRPQASNVFRSVHFSTNHSSYQQTSIGSISESIQNIEF